MQTPRGAIKTECIVSTFKRGSFVRGCETPSPAHPPIAPTPPLTPNMPHPSPLSTPSTPQRHDKCRPGCWHGCAFFCCLSSKPSHGVPAAALTITTSVYQVPRHPTLLWFPLAPPEIQHQRFGSLRRLRLLRTLQPKPKGSSESSSGGDR